MKTILKASCKHVWNESAPIQLRSVSGVQWIEQGKAQRRKDKDETVKGRAKGAKITRTRLKLENIEASFISQAMRYKKDERNEAKKAAKYAKRQK